MSTPAATAAIRESGLTASASRKTELLAAGIAVNAASSMEDALVILVDEGRALTGADGVSAALWDCEGRVGTVRAASGHSERFLGARLTAGSNAPYAAQSTGDRVVIRGETPTGVPEDARDPLAGMACRAAIPVSIDGVTPITIQAVWRQDPGDAAVSDALETFQALAAVTGLGRRATDEHARMRGDALLDAIVESIDDGIILRANGSLRANAAARRLLGWNATDPLTPEAIGLRRLDGTPLRPEEVPSELAKETGEPQRVRLLATRFDGGERVFEASVSRIVTTDGEDVGHVTQFRDVTEEHARELQTAGLLERLFSELPTAIAVWEPETFRVVSANRAFFELVGYEPGDVIGRTPPFPWWAEESAPEIPDWHTHDETYRWEHLYRHRDGRLVPTQGEAFALRNERGEPERIVGLIRDLSERREFEQQLVHSGKLAAIGELAAGVAHEINNPLFAILGLVEFLLNEVEPGSKAESRLRVIQETGLEIKEIVRALLDFAREPSDELGLVDLSEVCEKTIELIRRTTPTKGVELVERWAEEPTPVRASSNQLKQVILNLVTNAQHAAGDGGTVTVEVARDGAWAVATVTDTGPGIDPETITRIFDPFFTTKRSVGGTGLGLSVSLGIAQMHGGDLTVDSEPGRGSRFTLRVPIAQGGDS